MAVDSKTAATLALLQDWWTAWQQADHDPTQEVIVLAARRVEVDRLNTACQEVLAGRGRLGAERLQVEDRHLAVGDRVVCGKNSIQQLGVADGSRGTITALDSHDHTLTLRLDGTNGRTVVLPRSYLEGRGRGMAARRGRERRTARLLGPLERQGWAILHDLALPGSRANLDHLMIGPGGVFVVDSKQYRGRLQLDGSGRPWHGRYPLAPAVRAVSWEADQGAQVPWGKVATGGVPVVAARRLPSMLRALPAVLGPERVADWITSPGPLPRRRLTPAACRVALTLLLPQRATF